MQSRQKAQQFDHRSRATRRSHLTRRGRWVLAVGLMVTALLGGFVVSAAASPTPQAVAVGYVIVADGDSLWSIASEVGEGDVRRTVREIQKLNGMDGATLWPGMRLLVPADQEDTR